MFCAQAALFHTITTRHPSLHDDRLFALPGVQDRHPRDWGARFQREGIHCVIRANNERQVGIWKIVVDLIHFQYNCEIHTDQLGNFFSLGLCLCMGAALEFPRMKGVNVGYRGKK